MSEFTSSPIFASINYTLTHSFGLTSTSNCSQLTFVHRGPTIPNSLDAAKRKETTVCNNWNTEGKGYTWTFCARLHQCLTCSSKDHPAHKCKLKPEPRHWPDEPTTLIFSRINDLLRHSSVYSFLVLLSDSRLFRTKTFYLLPTSNVPFYPRSLSTFSCTASMYLKKSPSSLHLGHRIPPCHTLLPHSIPRFLHRCAECHPRFDPAAYCHYPFTAAYCQSILSSLSTEHFGLLEIFWQFLRLHLMYI